MDVNKMNGGHGQVGTREQNFSRLRAPRNASYDLQKLSTLATQMEAEDELHDGPDGEENLYVPAGYTYFGQFVDHDLTFDTTSSLDPLNTNLPTNLRTPRLDLDCVYGSGPDDQPYMYESEGLTKLRVGKTLDGGGKDDVIRIGDAQTGRAVIGDKRNDENSIVCQIQLAMIKFHNVVVDSLPGLSGRDLFLRAREEVRWTYQRILVDDYLPRIVDPITHAAFEQEWMRSGDNAYKLYTPEKRGAIPIEFAGAAYRFGHSMVRQGYRLNRNTALDIFDGNNDASTSLVGFQPLPSSHVIDDWRRFFVDDATLPAGARFDKNGGPTSSKNDLPDVRLQFAYKIDPTMANPLKNLPSFIANSKDFPANFQHKAPSLQLFNLFRGNKFMLQSGQAFAHAIGEAPLDSKYLQARVKVQNGSVSFTFVPIDAIFLNDTPLWFYILAEAQRPVIDLWLKKGANLTDEDFLSGPGAGSQLGAVGGRILLEVFYGLLDADSESFRGKTWKPLVGNTVSMWSLLKFAKLV